MITEVKEETINMDISKYISGNNVSEIRVGQSGANVYEINGDMILKHVQRNMLKNDLFDTYIKEALFYKNKITKTSRYLPEVLNVELSDDEIIILMKKYKQLERSNVDKEIEKIIEVLALVHNDTIPDFLRKIDNKNEPLSTDRIDYCLNGWKSVLNEHGNSFDVDIFTIIAEKINKIIQWHNDEEHILIHGDFHWDNLLKKDDQRLCVCDWQNVGIGGASEDLSFFISRLGADGIEINSETILNIYANAVYDISGKRIDSEEIKKHMAAANVVTTFEFWHEFLHGSTEDRVKGIFDKLINDYRLIDVI